MKKTPPVREDVPWTKRQEIPNIHILEAADQYEQARTVLAGQTSGVLCPRMNVASMAVELYLKALSADMIYVEDDLMPEVSRVHAAPVISSSQGHGFVGLLNAIPDDVRSALVAAFDAELKPTWRADIQSVLQGLEGVLASSRYPFEHGHDITKYNFGHLDGLARFLAHFVKTLPVTHRIIPKKTA